MPHVNSPNNGKAAVAIVGGGLAGHRCAETLRREGYGGEIQLVCAEPHLPYDRPPLSKEMLTGSVDAESLAYRSPGWYREQAIEPLLGVRAKGLRARERQLLLSNGASLRYDKLVIATGSRPRTLPWVVGYENVSALRTLDDAVLLRDALATQPRLAVIGAGFIGQEVAASSRKLGAEVTIIEAGAAPLEAVLGPELGGWFAWLHRAEGVEVLTGCTVKRVIGGPRIRALELSNGRVVETDQVVVGVGVQPDTEWLADTELGGAGGVRVDEHGQSAIAGVFAVGDAAATYDRQLASHVPGSHWEAAGRQAGRAARALLGLEPGSVPVTSFWSDQYGIRIQFLGRASGFDSLQIDGEPGARDFTATFLHAGRPVAALLVGRPRALAAIRNTIEKGAA